MLIFNHRRHPRIHLPTLRQAGILRRRARSGASLWLWTVLIIFVIIVSEIFFVTLVIVVNPVRALVELTGENA